MITKVLLIDDDPATCNLYQITLERLGFDVKTAYNGIDGLKLAYEHQPEIILLDIMMPELSGWDTCQRLRQMCNVPIIMLTALKQQEAIIKGLEMGADDYLVKPVTNTELAARMKAVLRRSNNSVTDFNDQDKVIKESHLIINVDKREVKSRGKRINLTPTEFRLLATLAQNRGRVLSRNFLIKHVWGEEYLDQKQYLHVYINYLRNKIEDDPNQPRLIQNVRSVGYRFGM
ncbi:MAG: response regulator transcription factor [Anaerolineae bacterium]|nr:response regulator transcription factor [Anaerolineae bacterium]MCB0178545.1 response regulator transcription factor [Anaerolineae bacterium]MCB9105753.1 response regulator transcription factor [Anaerolineales bacterium]